MPESKRPWVHNVRFAYRWRVVGTVPRCVKRSGEYELDSADVIAMDVDRAAAALRRYFIGTRIARSDWVGAKEVRFLVRVESVRILSADRGRQVSLIDPTIPRKSGRRPHDRIKKR